MKLQRPRTFGIWKASLVGVLSIALLVFGALQPASADPVTVGTQLVLLDGPGRQQAASSGRTLERTDHHFSTFCLETNEYFTPGELLRVSGISDSAKAGGVGGGGATGDPLDNRTAWLYTQFTRQTLTGYDFADNAARILDANSLQRAICTSRLNWGWLIHSQGSPPSGASTPRLRLGSTAATAVAGGWTNLNVVVLNLFRKDSNNQFTVKAQDQLYYVPAPVLQVCSRWARSLSDYQAPAPGHGLVKYTRSSSSSLMARSDPSLGRSRHFNF